MMRFFLHEFVLVRSLLHEQIEIFKKSCMPNREPVFISARGLAELHGFLSRLKRQCDNLELITSGDRIWRFDRRLEEKLCHCEDIATELNQISNVIDCELDEKTLAYIPSARAAFFEQEALFGDLVRKAFPSAEQHIKDAGNCLASELHTAAVFHLMCVVEIGLRGVAKQLKVKTVKKNTPLELGTWEDVIRELESKVNGRFPRSKKGQQESDFYKGLFVEFRAFKDLWRNKVMHVRIEYDSNQAQSAFDHVRDFMQRLVAHISE
jgi:hypothetical protein